MPVSRLDTAYRSLILSKFFIKGWGKPENLKKLFEFRKIVSKREACYHLVAKDYPVTITKESVSSDCVVLEGEFASPFEHYLPGLLPPASEKAYFQVLLPKKWQTEYYKPICLHLAGTGDHFFFRRRNLMAKPLLKEAGIGAILLENPFYGLRKPKDQHWSCLHNVSDIFVMGGCLMLESLVLFHWCKRNGLGPLGVTGISMGGHMASLAATTWPEPLVLVPCLSWSTASAVFTRGVMSSAINWELLERQYFSDDVYSKEIKQLVRIVEDNECYAAGQHFAKNYPRSMDYVSQIAFDQLDIKSEPWNRFTANATMFPPQLVKDISMNIGRKGSPQPAEENKEESSIQSDVLKEVLEEANDGTHLKILEKNKTKKLDKNDKSKILDYLSWKNRSGDETGVKEKRELVQKQEALEFMCGIMDECTHLTNFSVPVDTSLVIAIAAKDDAYVPRDGVTDIRDIWPDAEVRYLNAGHVGAYLLHQRVFRSAITDAFKRLTEKYDLEPTHKKLTEKNKLNA